MSTHDLVLTDFPLLDDADNFAAVANEFAGITASIVDASGFWSVPTDLEVAEFVGDILIPTELDKWVESCEVNEVNTTHFPTDIQLAQELAGIPKSGKSLDLGPNLPTEMHGRREIGRMGVDAFNPTTFTSLGESDKFNAVVKRFADMMDIDVPEAHEIEVKDSDEDEDSGEAYEPKHGVTYKEHQREQRKIWNRGRVSPRERLFLYHVHDAVLFHKDNHVRGVSFGVIRVLWTKSRSSLRRFIRANKRIISSNKGFYKLTPYGIRQYAAV